MRVNEVSDLLITIVAAGSNIIVNSYYVDPILINVIVFTDEGRIYLFSNVISAPVLTVTVQYADLVGLYVYVCLPVNEF